MKKTRTNIIGVVGLAASAVTLFALRASAQVQPVGTYTGHSGGNWGSFSDLTNSIGSFISTRIMPMIVLLALVYFFWNLTYFIRTSSNPKERETFRKYTINALIGLFVIMSVWGIVAIMTRTFQFGNPVVPMLPTSDNYHS